MIAVSAGVAQRPATGPAMRFASRTAIEPLAVLLSATQEASVDLEQIADWNASGRLPLRNGFVRPFLGSSRVVFSAGLSQRIQSTEPTPHDGGLMSRATGGGLSWSGEVKVEGAWRLRLLLAEVTLPPGTLLWVYGEGAEVVGPFGMELLSAEREIWTPSVTGESIRIEILLPPDELAALSEASFVVNGVLQIFELDSGGAPLLEPRLEERGNECFVGAQCNDVIQPSDPATLDLFQQGIAYLEFARGGVLHLCSGGLLNDMDGSTVIPYLMTANHCIDSQAGASSLEAFWDYYPASCNGIVPSLSSLPRSLGATLLATTSTHDSTLLQLHSIPGNRTLFGWNANPSAVGHDTVVHRISHPAGWSQVFSSSHIDAVGPSCESVPRPNFLYSKYDRARGDLGKFGRGSSGAPLLLPSGQVVGNLKGGCGPAPNDNCDTRNLDTDGAFSGSFALYAPFLTREAPSTCSRNSTTHCFVNSRFRVEMPSWRFANGTSGKGQVVPDFFNDNSGLFFFNNENDWQMQIKVLNGCGLNSRYWVFYAATTNVEFTVTVTDTQTGLVRMYFNPLNNPAPPIQDVSAFATCP